MQSKSTFSVFHFVALIFMALQSCNYNEPVCGYNNLEHQLIDGVYAYKTIEEGIECSQQTNKPIFLFFTGWAAVSSRYMEDELLGNKNIMQMLKNEFVNVTLYVDDKRKLPKNKLGERNYSKILNRNIKTIGDKNSLYQIEYFNKNTIPYFAILSSIDTAKIAEYSYLPNNSNQKVESILLYSIKKTKED